MLSMGALDVIGSGTFGLIRKVRRKSDGILFARKELNFERMSERDRKHIVSEVNILRTLQHDNVVRYEERYVDTENGILYIVMELCEGGDLGAIIKRCRRTKTHLPEDTVWSFFAQMTAALEACHYRTSVHGPPGTRGISQAILHRDLKPENVFLDADQNVKLGDFGLSKQIASQAFANTYVGTPYYMSPELATGQPYDIKSDVWALGCIVYELCALSPPFDAANQAELTRKIKQGMIPSLPRPYSRDLQEAVNAMLQLDHRRRPTTRQLLQIKQVKMACRTHEVALLHKSVQREKERLQAQVESFTAREAALAQREKELDERFQAFALSSDNDARLQALDEREVALHTRELELCRREEACTSYRQELLQQYCSEKAQMEEELQRQRRALQEKDTLIAQLRATRQESLSLGRVSHRGKPRRSSFLPTKGLEGEELLRSRIEEGALSLQSPASRTMPTATEEEWVDDEEPARTSAAVMTTTAVPSALARLRRAEADVSDCSMKDASCMWREALPWRPSVIPTPRKSRATSFGATSQAKSTTSGLPSSRTVPQDLNALPQDPQWLLVDEEERPSPFLKRVVRIPLESLKSDAQEDTGGEDVQLAPGPVKPRGVPARMANLEADQENAAARRRSFLEQRRRRSSLLRPTDARPALSSGIPRTDVSRTRLSALPSSPARTVRPFTAATRAR
ncbi:kinase-like protein [Malassezia pachydermatis]|uniref:non-specific serine/threonine protein kinase n=1 Tax=Malassezia pachydermatis TaxID=77020 RepID=A0A0M8MXJ6_9BASI|nr:kinase-like protein [Malassezia pachydermatis]KOS15571.1 kinase-like protein [Malassezia pachydermatis]